MEVDSEQYKKLEKSIHGLTELHLRQFCKSSGCEYGSPAGVCHKIVEQVNIVWSDMRECAWPLFPPPPVGEEETPAKRACRDKNIVP